jgi:hypothetical protein
MFASWSVALVLVAASATGSVTGVAAHGNRPWSPDASVHGVMPHAAIPGLHFPHFGKRTAAAPLDQAARRLRAMIADQEAWYSSHGRYGMNAWTVSRDKTRADASFEEVQVQVLYAGRKGWTAIATHPDAPGKSCVVFVGDRNGFPIVPRTRADALDASAEGRPVCDR